MAERTGLTVRALHHDDRKGLVSPSKGAESGHRLYTREDIARLQQMGFSLEQIKTLMERDDYDPGEVLRLQMERLRETIRLQQQLCDRLEELYAMISRRQSITTEQFLKTIEVMNVDPKT